MLVLHDQSRVAGPVELCLLDDGGTERRLEVTERAGHVWHGYVPDVQPGQLYGYRVPGPCDPAAGHRCNPDKLLLGPCARAIDGTVDQDLSLFGYQLDAPDEPNHDDSAAHQAHSVVVNSASGWARTGRRTGPGTRRSSTRHTSRASPPRPDVPEELRGTYTARGRHRAPATPC
ncbi:hypothetical protein ACFZA1_29330 [Streptomyces filipinensis]|uniref:hypothetical protein n=1 Tax=Streptomyces filipinensis TaxID=66887 RepID=UPI0036F03E40